VWVEEVNLDKTDYAMQSLKHSIRWDEERWDLELDLDRFMIVADGDDHEAVKVEIEIPALLIPADAVLERLHRVIGLVEVALFHPHLQQGRAAVLELEVLLLADQARSHQREQVGRFLERVFPLGV